MVINDSRSNHEPNPPCQPRSCRALGRHSVGATSPSSQSASAVESAPRFGGRDHRPRRSRAETATIPGLAVVRPRPPGHRFGTRSEDATPAPSSRATSAAADTALSATRFSSPSAQRRRPDRGGSKPASPRPRSTTGGWREGCGRGDTAATSCRTISTLRSTQPWQRLRPGAVTAYFAAAQRNHAPACPTHLGRKRCAVTKTPPVSAVGNPKTTIRKENR